MTIRFTIQAILSTMVCACIYCNVHSPETEDVQAFLDAEEMAGYLCYAVGNEWKFSHHGPDTVQSGTYDKEKITAHSWYDTTACLVSCHESDGNEVQDTVFVTSQGVHAALGFSYFKKRYSFYPPYRWYDETLYVNDTCIAAYSIRPYMDTSKVYEASIDTVIFRGADTVETASESYACIYFVFQKGSSVTHRWYAKNIGLVLERKVTDDSLRLEIRLERARVDGILRYLTWE